MYNYQSIFGWVVKLVAFGGDGPGFESQSSWNFKKICRIASASKCQCHKYELLLENQKTKSGQSIMKYYNYIIYVDYPDSQMDKTDILRNAPLTRTSSLATQTI